MTARLASIALMLTAAAACGPKRLILPTGPGAPAPDFRSAYEQASSACAGVRTLRATASLSGRAGPDRMRGTLIGGFEQPDAMRLEGVAPFGPPAFILAARARTATLLLPRDNRVLTGVSAADILEALAGVRLDPSELRAILTGCVTASRDAAAGRGYENGWMAVDLAGSATVYLRRDQGQWRIVAGLLPALEVQYGQFLGGLPRTVQIESRGDTQGGVAVSLTLALSDVATNVSLKPAAFTVDVPADAVPITLVELRDVGPLGVKAKTRTSGTR